LVGDLNGNRKIRKILDGPRDALGFVCNGCDSVRIVFGRKIPKGDLSGKATTKGKTWSDTAEVEAGIWALEKVLIW